MPETDAATSALPIHIEETIQSIAGLHAEHHANATPHQRVVDRITSLMGGAGFIAALTVFVVGWVSLNGIASALGAARSICLALRGWRARRRWRPSIWLSWSSRHKEETIA